MCWNLGKAEQKDQKINPSELLLLDTRQSELEKKRKARYKISLPMFMFLSFFPNRWWVSIILLLLFSRSVMSDSLQPRGLQHVRLPCPSPSFGTCPSPSCGTCSNSGPLSQWCHPNISSCVIPFSSCLESFLAWGSFPMSQFFPSGGQSIRASASASVLLMNIQGLFPLELTDFSSLQSKGLSRVFPNNTVQKHQFFGAQLSSQSNSHIHTWPQEKP